MARFRGAESEDGDLDMIQAVLDYVQHNGRDIRIGLLGLDSDNHLCYPDGHLEFDRDDDEYDSPSNPSVQYCGFAKNFLYPSKAQYQPRRRRKPQDDLPLAPPPPVSTENHAKRVSKLLEEEEKSKEKAERKRLKKLRQRERRRLAKLEKEKQNPNKNVEATCRPGGESVNGERRTSRDLDSSDGSNSSDEDSSEDEESDRENIAGNSEELDLTSSFVSKAAVIAKRQLEQMPKSEKRSERRTSPAHPPAPASRPKEKPNAGYNEFKKTSDFPSSEDVVKISTELAVTGNKFASAGHFAMAVKYFTDAIKYNPKEYRLFGNRSFCYEKMQEYERSLTDAELSLNMCPSWVKGLYRKGRALAGLQRYEEAAQAFKEVLQLDSSCVDAAQELMRVQITQLMEFGFSREQSSNALIIHGTVQKALEALSKISGVPVLKAGSYPTANPTMPAQIESSNPTVPARTASAFRTSTAASSPQPRFHVQAAQAAKPLQTQAQNTPKTQTPIKPTPRQPNSLVKTKPQAQPELFPIWVGNMVQTVTEPMLQDLFSSIGEVYSVKLLRSKRCAFVNFTNQQHCDAAIQKFHGHELHEARITVRYPDRIPNHLGISKAALQAVDPPEDPNGNSMRECFFWRNLGCSRRPACPYRHILEHKGIDRRKTSEQ